MANLPVQSVYSSINHCPLQIARVRIGEIMIDKLF